MIRRLLFVVALLGIPAAAQVFNCGGSGTTWVNATSGTCSVENPAVNSNSGGFYARNSATNPVSSNTVQLYPTNGGHNGYALNYGVTVNVQAFTTNIVFTPSGQNGSLIIQNTSTSPGYQGNIFSSGASCEAGFYQGVQQPPSGNITPNFLFALEFADGQDWLNNSATQYTNSTVQWYESQESPCVPSQIVQPVYWPTSKISESPISITSSSGTCPSGQTCPNNQYQVTGDTYSITISYDGSNLNMCLYDVTAANGSCSSATSGTGTYFQHQWTNVQIPSIVGGTTAYVGIAAGVNIPNLPPWTVNSWTYTANTPTATPTTAAYNANATTNNGTVSAATPVYSLAPGTYVGTRSVSLTTSTSGGYICYLTSATPPTLYPHPDLIGGCATGTLYTGPISIPATTTLYSMASLPASAESYSGTPYNVSNGPPSALTAATYTITAASPASAPTFSPAAGTYSGTQSVTVATTSSGAILCYTTNGTTPATNGSTNCATGSLYSAPVTVSSSLTLKAVAGGTGFSDSSVSSAAYTILAPGLAPAAAFSGKVVLSGPTAVR